MDTETVIPIKRPKASLERLALAETIRRDWYLTVLAGHTIEDVMGENYLLPLANRLRRHDQITISDDRDSFFAELLVLESSSDCVRVILMRAAELSVAQAIGAPGSAKSRDPSLRTHYAGPFLKWCVYRGDTLLKDKCASEAEAAHWLSQYQRTAGKAS